MKRISSMVVILSLAMFSLVPRSAGAQASTSPSIMKDETVYAILDPTGAVKSVIVSDWIHSDKPGVEIKDKSNLTNIENVKGYEQPRRVGDALLWKLDGSDLYYRGKSTKALPLQVSIRYWLDGKAIEPSALSGKAGVVRVKIDVKNTASADRVIDGVKKRIYAPMIAVAGLILPVTGYKDLSVTGGSIFTDGQSNIVAGLLLPGLKDSIMAAGGVGSSPLDLSSVGIKDLTLPESFEFTVTTDNFKLGSIFIAATSSFPEIGGPNTVKALDDALASFQQLADASRQIKEGSAALSNGVGLLHGSISQAISSVKPIIADNQQAIDAVTTFISNDDDIQTLRNILDSTKGLKDSLPEIYSFIDRFFDPKNQAAMARITTDAKKLGIKDLLSFPGASTILSDTSLTAMAEALVSNDDLYKGMDERRLTAASTFAANATPVFDALVNFDDTAKAYNPDAGTVLKTFGAKSADYSQAAGRFASLGAYDVDRAVANLDARAKADSDFVSATDFLDGSDAASLKAKLVSGEALSEADRAMMLRLFEAAGAERTAAASGSASLTATAGALPILADSARLANEARYASVVAADMSLKVLPGLAQAKTNRNKTEQAVASGRVMLDPRTASALTTTVTKIFTARRAFEKNKVILQTARTYLSMRMQDSGFRAQVNALDSFQKDLKELEPLLLQSQEALSSPQMQGLFAKSDSSLTAAKVKTLVRDLSNFQPILGIASDALKPESIKQVRAVLGDLPKMMSALDELSSGAKLLDEKMGELAAGTKQFDEQGIQMLSTEIVDKAKLLRGFLKVKDELTLLSRDYKTFSGAPEGAQTQLKFIFKTDEIR